VVATACTSAFALAGSAKALEAMGEMSTSDVIAILERALRAEIDVSDLAELWPQPAGDPYLAQVRDDLEFALEHIPGPRTGPWRPDIQRWKQMPEYEDLQRHIARLRAAR
jgi:hypothetical protein